MDSRDYLKISIKECRISILTWRFRLWHENSDQSFKDSDFGPEDSDFGTKDSDFSLKDSDFGPKDSGF